jgi:hypothetical protein
MGAVNHHGRGHRVLSMPLLSPLAHRAPAGLEAGTIAIEAGKMRRGKVFGRADRIERMFLRMADMYGDLRRENAQLRGRIKRLESAIIKHQCSMHLFAASGDGSQVLVEDQELYEALKEDKPDA